MIRAWLLRRRLARGIRARERRAGADPLPAPAAIAAVEALAGDPADVLQLHPDERAT